MRNLEQCEGCEYPLARYLDEYERGEINVTWILCHYHDYESTLGDNGAETSLYDTEEDSW